VRQEISKAMTQEYQTLRNLWGKTNFVINVMK